MRDFTPSADVKANQRSTLLKHMREHGGISTLEGREIHGIQGVAPRIFELRNLGHDITTTRVLEQDSQGRFHPMAFYRLRGAA